MSDEQIESLIDCIGELLGVDTGMLSVDVIPDLIEKVREHLKEIK